MVVVCLLGTVVSWLLNVQILEKATSFQVDGVLSEGSRRDLFQFSRDSCFRRRFELCDILSFCYCTNILRTELKNLGSLDPSKLINPDVFQTTTVTMPDKRKASKIDADSPAKEEEEETADAAEETQKETSAKRKSEGSKKSKAVWSATEDEALLKAVIEDQQDREAESDGEDDEDWDEIAKSVPGKTPVQCFRRYISLNKKQQASSTGAAASGSAVASGSAAAEKEGEEESTAAKKAKRPKKEADPSSSSSGKWSTEEIELLKKLVEQYKDSTSKITSVLQVALRCGSHTHCKIFYCFCWLLLLTVVKPISCSTLE